MVVFDPEIDAWMDNRIFDEGFASNWPGGLWPAQLSQLASSKGILIETIDHFENRKLDLSLPTYLIVMANRISPAARKIIYSKRAAAGVCICLESPLVAYDFYHNLNKYSSWFLHVFTFAGAGNRVRAAGTKFHPILWPYQNTGEVSLLNWSERNYLTLINSNRRAKQNIIPKFNIKHPRNSLKDLLNHFRVSSALKNDPWFGRELYLDRLEAVRHFYKNSGFDLYGRGWDKPIIGVKEEFNHAVRSAYRGEIHPHEKLSVLNRYKFAICFENSSFPGYITEKILDCFMAGCIPIYLGAPDIGNFIPERAFIDFRRFESYRKLEKYLMSIDEQQANNYLEAAKEFLNSPDFDPFKSKNFANDIMTALEDCFIQNEDL